MDFTAFLQKELGPHSPSEIEELILDNLYKDLPMFSLDQKKSLEQYTSLMHLSLNNLGLVKLDNFPSLLGRQILELNNNQLKGNDLRLIAHLYPNLYKIKLSNNLIESVDVFKAFENNKIMKIEVKDNPFCKTNPNYTKELYEIMKELRVIDGQDKNMQFVDTTNYDEEEESESELINDFDDEEEEFEDDLEDDEDFEDGDSGPNKKNKF